MQTALADFIRDTQDGKKADNILRACVHCGFCTATCPTYQLLGDELDGPRGRIYQIKSLLEGEQPETSARDHLDRCLTCLSCETTCPSGVSYGKLLDIGRRHMEERLGRPWQQRLQRAMLRAIVPYRSRFAALMGLARLSRPMLPTTLKQKVPAKPSPVIKRILARHERRMLVLGGCVQPTLDPEIDAAAAQVLDRLGISLVEAKGSGCCGALCRHLSDDAGAKKQAKRNIDAWWGELQAGVEAIIASSSARSLMLKDRAELLADSPDYAEKARAIAGKVKDISEVLAEEDLSRLEKPADLPERIAFHAPCTLQHGQKLAGKVEALLGNWGVDLLPVPEPHLCCGSAGAYSLLQADISTQLRERKLNALHCGRPELIATANIGCLNHLQGGTETPVVHWIELLDGA